LPARLLGYDWLIWCMFCLPAWHCAWMEGVDSRATLGCGVVLWLVSRLYPLASMLNSSCWPNAHHIFRMRPSEPPLISFVVVEPVAKAQVRAWPLAAPAPGVTYV
jgi:hypothetical protein